MTDKRISPLPKSDDPIWEGAETYRSTPVPFKICSNHTKEHFTEGVNYEDNGDGTATCQLCGWGFRVPGYMRVHAGRVYDLRKV